MTKPRLCPFCQKQMPQDSGYRFDDQLNLICASCGNVAYPAQPAAEVSLTALIRSRAGSRQLQPYEYNNNHLTDARTN